MTISKSGPTWSGTHADDLDEYLRAFSAGGYVVGEVVHARCSSCERPDSGFAVTVDDEEGAATRRCLACADVVAMLDSGEYLEDADLGDAACPCEGEEFDVAVGFSLYDDGEARWVSVGLRCREDDLLGVYTDWKIGYSPSRHLLAAV